jgi:fatty-acid desaturase
MSSPSSTARVDSNNGHSSPIFGQVYWSSTKSFWITAIYAGAILGGYATFRWDALLLMLITSIVTLGAGYSVGIHRRLIHNSFQCYPWLEHSLVYLGVLTGMGGPFSLIGTHDLHDWAQRQVHCHDYFIRSRNIFTDWVWQVHCDIALHYPPVLRYESRIAENEFYQWLEQTWMLQQLPWVIVFYHFGGWSWLFWGVYVRIAVSVTGYWLLGYLTHHRRKAFDRAADRVADRAADRTAGDRTPRTLLNFEKTSSFQCRNLPWLSLFSMGESLQSNHQTFPNSAKFSLHPRQYDPGWWLIKAFQAVGLTWNIQKSKPYWPSPMASPIASPVGRPNNRPVARAIASPATRSATGQIEHAFSDRPVSLAHATPEPRRKLTTP